MEMKELVMSDYDFDEWDSGEIRLLFYLIGKYGTPKGIVKIWEHIGKGDRQAGADVCELDTLEFKTKEIYINAMIESDWIQKVSAQKLGITPMKMCRECKRYDIKKPGTR